MAKFCQQTRTDHVQDICWVLRLYGSSFQKMTFFTKITCSRRTSQQLLTMLLLIARPCMGPLAAWLHVWPGCLSRPVFH